MGFQTVQMLENKNPSFRHQKSPWLQRDERILAWPGGVENTFIQLKIKGIAVAHE